ncbi:PDX2 Predicted glutamine amidotransferase involved in pyridoxine biosynthesis [Candidatus Nanopelagicaceae bacterium]
MKVGVLALQGDFREHILATTQCGYDAIEVRRLSELESVDALILPGGESTTIVHLAKTFELFDPIRKRIADGLPVYGSCAGMILLAERILDGAKGQETFGGLDITVRRNAFGRQVDSFESELTFNGKVMNAVFIRAPWVEQSGPGVQVLAQAAGHAVAVREGKVLATSFHPELTSNLEIHRYFFEEMCKGR